MIKVLPVPPVVYFPKKEDKPENDPKRRKMKKKEQK